MNFDLKRSITIKASKKKVMGLVLDFKYWNDWSPWTIAEPESKMTVSGKPGKVGHEMHWGGKIIGSGKNTLTRATDKRLDYDLEFLTPYKSKSKVSFTFSSSGKSTKVTWYMQGSMPFFMFFMIPMMKTMLGMDFDRGLKMLKALAEEGKVHAKTVNKGTVKLQGFSYIGLQRTTTMDKIGDVMQKDFDKIINDVVVKNGKSAKHWISVYTKMNMRKNEMTYIAAVSDENLQDIELGSDYVHGEVQTGKALEIHHAGSYNFLGNAWSMGMMYIRAKKMKQADKPFEHYWNSPKETTPEKLKTSVYFPLR